MYIFLSHIFIYIYIYISLHTVRPFGEDAHAITFQRTFLRKKRDSVIRNLKIRP